MRRLEIEIDTKCETSPPYSMDIEKERHSTKNNKNKKEIKSEIWRIWNAAARTWATTKSERERESGELREFFIAWMDHSRHPSDTTAEDKKGQQQPASSQIIIL